MKKYSALRAVSGLLIISGWLIIVLAVIGSLGLFLAERQTTFGGGPAFMAIIFGLAVSLLGILIVAAGELIEAVADIAVNTAHLPAIAATGAKTVSFFEHMSGRANKEDRREPAVPKGV